MRRPIPLLGLLAAAAVAGGCAAKSSPTTRAARATAWATARSSPETARAFDPPPWYQPGYPRGGPSGAPPGFGSPGMPGLPGHLDPGPAPGRYTVAASGGSAVLVDTATGKTWVLQRPAGGGPPVWLPAERIDDPAEAQKWRAKNAAEQRDVEDRQQIERLLEGANREKPKQPDK